MILIIHTNIHCGPNKYVVRNHCYECSYGTSSLLRTVLRKISSRLRPSVYRVPFRLLVRVVRVGKRTGISPCTARAISSTRLLATAKPTKRYEKRIDTRGVASSFVCEKSVRTPHIENRAGTRVKPDSFARIRRTRKRGVIFYLFFFSISLSARRVNVGDTDNRKYDIEFGVGVGREHDDDDDYYIAPCPWQSIKTSRGEKIPK